MHGHMTMPVKRHALVHRVSWEMHVGPIPDGMLVCHKCDNPPCVRPDHLFLGSDADNLRDMAIKGRAGSVVHPEKLLRGDAWKAAHPLPEDCIAGHPKTPENKNKFGQCIPCKRDHGREAMRRRTAAFKAAGLNSRGTGPIAL